MVSAIDFNLEFRLFVQNLIYTTTIDGLKIEVHVTNFRDLSHFQRGRKKTIKIHLCQRCGSFNKSQENIVCFLCVQNPGQDILGYTLGSLN